MNRPLKSLAKVLYGESPATAFDEDGQYPIVGTGGEFGRSSNALYPAGLVVPRKGSLGHPQLLETPFWPTDTTFAVIPSKDVVGAWLYYHLLLFDLSRLNEATGVPSISRDRLERVLLFDPGFDDQKKIVKILQTIDRAIEKTEALIQKYRQIKAGLMHDLFTRGIGPEGKLRPPRDEFPDLYQETSIGWIPKEWEVKQCSQISQRICVGIVIQPTKYYVRDGVPTFRSANVRETGLHSENLVFISRTSNSLLQSSQIRAGDVLSVRTGYPGTSAVVPPEHDGCNCVDILITTPSRRVLPEFLCDWVNSSFGKGQVLRQQGGMAQQHFNVREMRELLVGVPNKDEQSKICRSIGAASKRIIHEGATLEKLRKQKDGLMHDLLSGAFTSAR